MDRKEFLELPMTARREILRLQTDNAIYRKAIDDFCEFHRALKRMQDKPNAPQAIHWTLKQILELGSHPDYEAPKSRG